MKCFDPAPDFLADYVFSERGQDDPMLPDEGSGSQGSGFGYSVQMVDLNDTGYLDLQVSNHGAFERTLNDCSILHSSFVDNLLPFPDSILPNELDDIISHHFSNEPDSIDNLSFPASTLTDSQPTVSPSLCSTATAAHFSNKVPQRRLLTDAVEYKAADSFGTGRPAPEKASVAQDRKAGEGKCPIIDKLKRRRAKYFRTPQGKMSRAKYLASEKGVQTKARSQAKYRASEKGKIMRAISGAGRNVYRLALRSGFSIEMAKEKGVRAAEIKRAELLGGCPRIAPVARIARN